MCQLSNLNNCVCQLLIYSMYLHAQPCVVIAIICDLIGMYRPITSILQDSNFIEYQDGCILQRNRAAKVYSVYDFFISIRVIRQVFTTVYVTAV